MVPSLVGGIKQIWRTEGLPGFFTGYKATLIRDVPYTMLELGLYDNFKTLLKKYQKREQLTTMEELGAAAVTGGIIGFVTNPLDLVKTRLMTGVRACVRACVACVLSWVRACRRGDGMG